ncbi:hypothetical protein C0J52_24291 [Blattella germanica]|nr:hypothetical protein C0J52_24291 [Blattella germanica]
MFPCFVNIATIMVGHGKHKKIDASIVNEGFSPLQQLNLRHNVLDYDLGHNVVHYVFSIRVIK